MATSADVARLAGVSQSTVSYVMSGARSISDETRAKVEAAMKQLDYHPNAGARALAGRRTSVIGLVAKLPGNTDVAALLPFIEAISGYCREKDYDVVLVTEDEGPAGLERLAGRAIADGIVLMDIRRDDDRVAAARRLNVPVVLIGVPDDPRDLDCVDFDVNAAGRLALQELADAGHDHIVVVGEPPSVRASNFGFIAKFFAGTQQAAADAGVQLEMYEPDADGWAGFAGFTEMIRGLSDQPVGVVARTPQAIDMVMQLLLSEGLVPGVDVSLVGVCTDSNAEAFRFPVTNVSPEPRDVSRRAMDRLFARLRGDQSTHGVELIAPRLTHRATTIERIS